MIKAVFPEGMTTLTVNGLHQWDYGQKLQIQASGLPALVEVHFACDGMEEAVVRSCAVTSGTLTAAIPDVCLEQTSPVLAWVYNVGASSGITVLTVILTIIARARPQPGESIPTEISDKYTEAVTAMNAAINNISAGNVTTARAIADADGNNIPNTYASKTFVSDKVNGTKLSTDILACAAELASTGAARVVQVAIGADYATDASGNPVNLPSKNCINSNATIMTYAGYAVVYIWGRNGRPTYYRGKGSGSGWGDWVTVLDSSNIGNYATAVPIYETETTWQNDDGGTSFTLRNNTLYLAVATYSTASGAKTVCSGLFYHTTSSSTHWVSLGTIRAHLQSGDHITLLDRDNTPADYTVNVKFYSMGAIATA